MVQAPAVPTAPSNVLEVDKVMWQSGIIAAGVVILYLAYFSIKRDTVKNERQFSYQVDARRLGTIYHESKSASPFGDFPIFGHVCVSDVCEFLIRIPGVGRIPLLKRFSRKNEKTASMLITDPLRSFWFVEANKMVASQIRNQLKKANKKVILVTSVAENEGKSTVSANLALALAQEKERVLLLDCDFRKPSLYKVFELSEDKRIEVSQWTNQKIQPVRYGETDLYLMAGSAATELNYEAIQAVIQMYQDEMDYIILDSSPMALVSDTEELANLAQASVLVVREDTAMAKNINDVIDGLNRTPANLLGCVLSDASRGFSSHSSYGDYYGYAGYGGYYGTKKR